MFPQPGMSGDCAYHNRIPQLKAETMKGLDLLFFTFSRGRSSICAGTQHKCTFNLVKSVAHVFTVIGFGWLEFVFQIMFLCEREEEMAGSGISASVSR